MGMPSNRGAVHSELTLGEVARLVEGELRGDPEHPVQGVAGLDGLTPGALTFVENARAAREAEGTLAGALLAPPGTETTLPTVWVKNPRVSFARMLEHCYPRRRAPEGVHSSASVHPDAEVHPSAHVGPGAVIGAGAVVEARCEIQARAVVGEGCQVGEDTRLLPGAILGADSRVGRATMIGPLTSIGAGAVLGNDVEIGARCRLDRCVVKDGVRIDNLVRVDADAEIGEHAILVSQCMVCAEVVLGRYCVVAAQALVPPGLRVGDGAQVAGRARPTADVPPGQAAWAGDPAVGHRDELRREAQRAKALDAWHRMRRQERVR